MKNHIMNNIILPSTYIISVENVNVFVYFRIIRLTLTTLHYNNYNVVILYYSVIHFNLNSISNVRLCSYLFYT